MPLQEDGVMDARAISTMLAETPLFEELDGDARSLISRHAREMRIRRGQQIFSKGEVVRGFYFLVSGKIKLAFLSSRGTEKIVDLILPGQSFGESMVLAGHPWPFYAQAIRDSRVLFIERNLFLDLLAEHASLKDYLLRTMSTKLCELFSQMEAICLQTSRERVVGYLLREVERARAQGGADDLVELPDTKANIASLLNLTPETFSRIIHTLEREQVIALSRRQVRILDLARLQQGCGC